MKFKNLILSVALVLGSCSDAMLATSPKQVKDAKLSFSNLKRALKCVHKRQGCTTQERRKIIGYGSVAIAAVLLLGVGGLSRVLRQPPALPPALPASAVAPMSVAPPTEEQRGQIQDSIGRLQADANLLGLDRFMPTKYTEFTQCLQIAADISVALEKSRAMLRCARAIVEEAQRKKKELAAQRAELRRKNRELLSLMTKVDVSLQNKFAHYLTNAEAEGEALATVEGALRGAQNVLNQMKAALPRQE